MYSFYWFGMLLPYEEERGTHERWDLPCSSPNFSHCPRRKILQDWQQSPSGHPGTVDQLWHSLQIWFCHFFFSLTLCTTGESNPEIKSIIFYGLSHWSTVNGLMKICAISSLSNSLPETTYCNRISFTSGWYLRKAKMLWNWWTSFTFTISIILLTAALNSMYWVGGIRPLLYFNFKLFTSASSLSQVLGATRSYKVIRHEPKVENGDEIWSN